ncbi:MAG: sensor histidine kinase [Hespellia sp.]|nr:sensor histidine kinase [Hespellia sp.]
MKKAIRKVYDNLTLAAKIRLSYLFILIPFGILLLFASYNLWESNKQYDDMIQSAVVASDFSLDFKKDFDYETYLLIVESKPAEQSELDHLLNDANRIVTRLEKLTNTDLNETELSSVKKYLINLESYKLRIIANLKEGDKYEENMEIWENDVQVVTELLQDSMYHYQYYEIVDLQKTSEVYQETYLKMIQVIITIAVIIGILVFFLSYYIPLSITRPILKLSKVTEQVAKGDLTVRSDIKSGVEVLVLSNSLNTMVDKINELLEQVKEEQIHLRKAEFEILQAQINPHFLYNTLDTIVWLAEAGDQKKVVSMVGSLSEFFRTSLSKGEDIVSIKSELLHVRSYLEIQQVRYQDILQYELQVPENLEPYRIPKISIQPIVENALYHGIKNKRGVGKITIGGAMKADYLLLWVKDDGIGFTQERLSQIRARIHDRKATGKENYGLYNVNERIRLNFGEAYGVSIESVYTEYTIVSVKLPYLRA